MTQRLALTKRQRQYIWLMGSFPDKIAVQGRGYRNEKLMYGFDEDAGELVIFGYSHPLMWLKNRGLVRNLANHPRGYTLTEEGEAAFARLRIESAVMSDELREVKVAAKPLESIR